MKRLFLALCMLSAGICAGAQAKVVDSLELYRGVCTSPAELLRGAVSGVRVSSTDGNHSSELVTAIRGIGTLYGNANPLWIVDGTILSDPSGQIMNAYWMPDDELYSYTNPLSQLDYLNLYDIESIEVLKDASATAIYGSRGANGVIIIKTKMPDKEKLDVKWNSNAGIVIGQNGVGAGYAHNHNVSVGYVANRASYSLSAFYRDVESPVPADVNRFGGMRIKFDTRTNGLIWFGLNSAIAAGNQGSACAAGNYGAPTLGLALRGIEIPGMINTVEGWKADYENYNVAFRANSDIYLQVNILPWLCWRTDISFDMNNGTRYFWNGLGTQFGYEVNRASAISLTSIMTYNAKTALKFDRFVSGSHHLKADLAAEAGGDIVNYNTYCGDHYFTDVLREKGFSLRESASYPRRFATDYLMAGAMASVSYDYKGLFGINAMIRGDKYREFDAEMTIYPSVSVYADIAKAFFPGAHTVSGFKLKAGWGKAGMRKYVPYQTLSNFVDTDYMSSELSTLGIDIDESVPEKNVAAYFYGYSRNVADELNAGFDADMFDGRLSLGVTFYDRKVNDRFSIYSKGKQKEGVTLWSNCTPYVVLDYNSQLGNTGLEFDVKGLAVKMSELELSAYANASWNTFKTLFVPMGSYNIAGNPVPNVIGALGATLKWNRLSVDAQVDGAAGGEIVNMNAMVKDGAAESETDDYLEKSDFLRLGRLAASWEFDVRKVKWLKGLSASISATNLLTLTGYSGWNPDVNCFGSVSTTRQGIDYGSLPAMSTIMVGVRANF